MIIDRIGYRFESEHHLAARIAHAPNLLATGFWIGTRTAVPPLTQEDMEPTYIVYEREPRWPNFLLYVQGCICTNMGVLPTERARLAMDHEAARELYPECWEVGLTVISIPLAGPLLLPPPKDLTAYRATPEQMALLRQNS